ncbi:hypothetical protein Syun_016028 [Stephania yunnanensis]|uniref:SKP1 component dimerisation domain-containing protein n=1 Tax=Stephania yunnanensis TaxID=152371 RepID=A0AAP0J6S6_9MAGN
MDTKKLCELTSAADSLQLKPLVDLTSRALARMIEGKTPEEIRETFHLPDDLTEEEKLEPLRNTADDPRIRLLNRLYAKKKKRIKRERETKAYRFRVNVEIEEEEEDHRSVDDLLSYINGGNGDSKQVRAPKHKTKNKKKKDQSKDHCCNNANKNCKVSNHDRLKQRVVFLPHVKVVPSASQTPKQEDSADDTISPKVEFDDDIDDELDPAMKEKLDREVEDFARRLNSDWPERMQEILSLGQEGRAVPISMKGNGSLRRYTSMAYSSG